MKLSVITLAFNQGEFLAECLDSVEALALPVEHIVVDPGSTDQTQSVLATRPHVDIVKGPDTGPSHGLNRGIARSSGDVICCLNGDDFFLPGSVEYVLRTLSTRPDIDILYGDGWVVDQWGRHLRPYYSCKYSTFQAIYDACPVMHAATFFRRRVVAEVGGFNVENDASWDGEFLLRAALAGSSIVHLKRPVAALRVYGASISGSGRHAAMVEDLRREIFESTKGRAEFQWERVTLGRFARLARLLRNPRATMARLWFGPTTALPIHERSLRAVVTRIRAALGGSCRS